jgi:phosphoribosylanthranilate isomerase
VIRVKICGVTTPEDARLAADLGASAIGMVMWPHSPRHVEVDRARAIVEALPPFVSAVGVFVDQVDAQRLADAIGLHILQFHGDEPAVVYRDCRRPVIKAIAVRDRSALDAVAAVPARATVLLDAHDPEKRGGTGTRIDWATAARRPVILSGGLNPHNVTEAIETVHPIAIDVSSGVESAPGRKDPAKLRALFDVIRGLPIDSSFGIRHS